jgi:Lar family restriction alleviation protein
VSETEPLLPCPFCAGDRLVVLATRDDSHGFFYVFCDCQAEGPPGSDPTAAAAAWNRRAPPPVTT